MANKSKKILTEISAGELLDKIAILEIKLVKIKDKENLLEINKEYESLKETKNSNIKLTKNLEKLIIQLKEINLKLWDIEDKKRICEKNKDFGQAFVDLSRSVYLNNDKRANIKSEINKILGSNIREIKKYVNY
jgi:hypothetical protein|tara:strand:+ start:173 stop:574 length:402 start_codon:yes stop_codon:yes gene_type:complete